MKEIILSKKLENVQTYYYLLNSCWKITSCCVPRFLFNPLKYSQNASNFVIVWQYNL